MRKGIFHLVTGTAACGCAVGCRRLTRRRNTIPARPTPKSRSARPIHSAGAGLLLCHDRQDAGPPTWKMINDQGGVNGRKINLIQYDDGLLAAESGSSRFAAAVRRATKVAAHLPAPRHALERGGCRKYLNSKKVAAAVRPRPGASKFHRPEELPLGRWASTLTTSSRDAIYGQYILKEHPKRPRSESSIRTTTSVKDYLNGIKAGPRRQGGEDGGWRKPPTKSPIRPSIRRSLKIKGCRRGTCSSRRTTPKQAGAGPIKKIAELNWKAGCTSSTSTPPRSALS